MNFLRMVAIVVALNVAFPLMAKEGKGKGHSKHAEKHSSKKEHHKGDVEEKPKDSKEAKGDSHSKLAISQKEREVFHWYVHNEQARPNHNLPPGLAKKVARGKGLPPGWQKKVCVGQVMPPDVWEVACPLPKDLVIKLPPSPAGTITVAVQGKIVRLMEKTKEILDILDLPTPTIKRS